MFLQLQVFCTLSCIPVYPKVFQDLYRKDRKYKIILKLYWRKKYCNFKIVIKFSDTIIIMFVAPEKKNNAK